MRTLPYHVGIIAQTDRHGRTLARCAPHRQRVKSALGGVRLGGCAAESKIRLGATESGGRGVPVQAGEAPTGLSAASRFARGFDERRRMCIFAAGAGSVDNRGIVAIRLAGNRLPGGAEGWASERDASGPRPSEIQRILDHRGGRTARTGDAGSRAGRSGYLAAHVRQWELIARQDPEPVTSTKVRMPVGACSGPAMIASRC